MPAELALRSRIVRALRVQGAYVLVTTGVAMAGTPDLLVCYQGRFIGLEVKVPKGHVEPIQLVRLAEIRFAGGTTAIVHSVEEALAALPA